MKNFLISIILIYAALPALAVCPLTGICTTPSDSTLASDSLQDKYVPNNLDNLRKSTSFSPQYVEPYDSMRMNTGESVPQYSPSNLTPQLPYNSNCQFGTCIP